MSEQFHPNRDVNPLEESAEANGATAETAAVTEATDAPAATPQESETSWWKKTPVLIGIGVVILVIALIAIFVFANKGGESGNAAQEAQTNLPAPALGSRAVVNTMELKINGETAPVDFVQLTEQGSLIPPTDVSRLGWYSASAVPGAPDAIGSSVITGHINEAEQGEGYAALFPDLEIGDIVTVIVDGEERNFEVSTSPLRVVKGDELPESINDAVGDNRLVLVTCGGEFVGGTLGYSDNIIVEAVPV